MGTFICGGDFQYFFLSKNDLFRIKKCEIGPCNISDHNLVYVDICLNRTNGSTLWRIYLDHNENEEVSRGILCCTLKALIRGKINSISSYLKKSSWEKFHLEEKLLDLQHLHSVMLNADIKSDIIKLKKETDDIYAMDIRKKIFL